MTRRTRSSSTKTRVLALAPVTLALVLGATVCYLGIDNARAVEATAQASSETAAERHSAAVRASYHRFAETHAARERVRQARPAPCQDAREHRKATASAQPDTAATAPARSQQRRCGRYAFFLILLVAWYALGVALMPWIAPRRARRSCSRKSCNR